MNLVDRLVRLSLPVIPRAVLWTVAQRYVAGARLEDGLQRIRALRAEGFGTILDVLGESVDRVEDARAAAAEYSRALEALAAVDPHTTISVKPTHLGLLLDRTLCARLLDELCTQAAAAGRRVRFEMEDASTIDGTLSVFGELRGRHSNLGCVLQSRLFRTAGDVSDLLAAGPGLNVRLVKGIYLEPPEIAWTRDEDIARSYVSLCEQLVAGGACLGLATHDLPLAQACLEVLSRHGVLPDSGRYEFQLLMGVRRDVADELHRRGHPVRIYVPYGKDWHAYSLRRLTRNPQIARHVLAAMFRRGG